MSLEKGETMREEVTTQAEHTAQRIKNSVWLPKTEFSMRANLPTKEPEILKFWQEIGLYQRLRAKAQRKEKFILHYGPPYANGAIHTGHALTEGLKDIINKTKQMQGFDAPLVPGWDCHGLPIEWQIEEGLRKKGQSKADIPTVDFLKKCREFASQWIDCQKAGFIRFGICADWENYYCTMDSKSESVIAACLLDIFMKGLLYHGKKPVLWSVVEQTALAEAEVEYKDHVSESIYVLFPIKASEIENLQKAFAVIWTTTPWTLPANRAISFNKNFTYSLIQVMDIAPAEKGPYPSLEGKKLLVAKELLEDFCHKNGITRWSAIEEVPGEKLIGTIASHPFAQSSRLTGSDQQSPFSYDFDVPLIYGDHVTLDAGTGLVHTAPSHGIEDYTVGKAFHIDMPDLVQGDGTYVSNLPLFAGQHIFKVAPQVIEVLKDVGLLASSASLTHSYPHSWRSKSPLIYRLTSQWFLDIDALRERTLNVIDQTHWFPKQSINRIKGMVELRPDWCLSRQRVWGVPIVLFLHKETQEPLRDLEVNAKVISVFEQEGIEAWHQHDEAFFLGEERAQYYEKVMDTLDVWFDSACTHEFVLKAREGLAWPADLYLEGYDQHRGWFQSSLIESIALHDQAPYKNVFSHGFILDQEGRKMSKSLGNVLSCDDLIARYGADVTRLWIIGTDSSDDVRIGPEIMKRQEDIYRRFRNTLRYLLGILNDYDEKTAVDYDQLPDLEKYILTKLTRLAKKHLDCIEKFDLSSFYADLHVFCTNELSAFYFDVRKDSLYCDAKESLIRRSCQTVMKILFDYIVRWLAPVLSFTAEEAWQEAYGHFDVDHASSIHEQEFLPVVSKWEQGDLFEKWERIRQLRKVILFGIEKARNDGLISSSLQAVFTLSTSVESDKDLFKDAQLLTELAIVSEGEILFQSPLSDDITVDDVRDVGVKIRKAEGTKCQRCWKIIPHAILWEGCPLCSRCMNVLRHQDD